MMYYIDRIEVKNINNKKGLALKQFIKDYEQCLIRDRDKVEEVVSTIRRKVGELNTAYPRTSPLTTGRLADSVYCYAENRPGDHVFFFKIKKIMKVYE